MPSHEVSVTGQRERPNPSANGRATLRDQGGFLLVTVLLVVVVLGILVVGTSTTSLIDRQVASRQRAGTEAHYLAHVGLDRVRTALFLALSELEEDRGDYCGPPADLGVDLGGGLIIVPGVLSAPIADLGGAGYYQVQFSRTGGFYVVTSVGWLGTEENRGAQATVQLVATAGIEPFGAWDNAIFTEELSTRAGRNQTTGTIAAYGSVHIVRVEGDELDLDPDAILVEYSGSSGVFNNYNGHGTQSYAVDQAVKALSVDRAYPYDLCSRLKVEDGSVRVATAAAGIGAPGDEYDADGEWIAAWTNPEIGSEQVQSIEGVYLGTGNLVYQSQGQTEVYARSGVVEGEGYLDLHMGFPELEVGFPDGDDVIVLTNTNCALIGDDGVMRVPPESPGAVACPRRDDGTYGDALVWDEERKVLAIQGSIAVPDADLSIMPRAGGEAVSELYFDGLGKFLVGTKSATSRTGMIEIGMEVLPFSPGQNYLNVEGATLEPALHEDAHGLAFVTAGDIDLRGVTGAGSTVSGLFYAEGKIDLPQQVSIVGAVVGRNVNVQQVPRVLWHPDVVAMAEYFALPGSVADIGGHAFSGQWDEVSIEIR